MKGVPVNDWMFDDPPNVAVLTTVQVLQGDSILYVSHDKRDGVWQFHTGLMGTELEESDARVVALQRILELDPSIEQLAELPLGWVATRENVSNGWKLLELDM